MLDKLKAVLTDAVNGKLPKLNGSAQVPHAFGFGGGRGAFARFRFHPPGAPAPASATPTL